MKLGQIRSQVGAELGQFHAQAVRQDKAATVEAFSYNTCKCYTQTCKSEFTGVLAVIEAVIGQVDTPEAISQEMSTLKLYGKTKG